MPFYEYACDSCGHQFERMQRITAEPCKECEKCGAPVRRVIFPSAIIYKGSGFYATEYGRSTYNNPAKAEKKEEGSSSSTSSDSSSKESSSKDGGSKDSASKDSSSKDSSSKSSTSDGGGKKSDSNSASSNG